MPSAYELSGGWRKKTAAEGRGFAGGGAAMNKMFFRQELLFLSDVACCCVAVYSCFLELLLFQHLLL